MTIKEIELHAKRYYAEKRYLVPEVDALRKSGGLKFVVEHTATELIFTLSAEIYGARPREGKAIRYPADWWEAAKERFAPVWFTARWPVKFKEFRISLEEIYPEFRPSIPDNNDIVKILLYEMENTIKRDSGYR